MILHTVTKGSGEAIVFLHTGLQTSATDFIHQQTTFSAHYQVISPDLRGHGKSASVDISDFFEDSAKDLDETFEEHGIQSAHVVGASLGALAAIFFAKRFPARVKTLTISGVTKQKPVNWLEMHRQDAEMQAGLLDSDDAGSYFTGLHGPDWTRFITMGRSEDWYPFNETADLTGLSSPILIIAGEGSLNEVRSALEYKTEMERVHTSIIPFASHLVHAEQPELYSNVLDLFLKNV